MDNLIKKSESWIECFVVAWWIHVVPSIKGRVLLIGKFNSGTIDYLSQHCDELYILSKLDCLESSNGNVIYVNNDNYNNKNYDSIIIDAVKTPLNITDFFLSNLINNSLCKDGRVCYLEPNQFSLKSNTKNIIKKIFNLIFDLRFNNINKLGKKLIIIKFPTTYYKHEPHESFLEGAYATNKNIFITKEKIRIFLLRTRFSRLFVNSNIWLISKKSSSIFFHQEMLDFIAEKQSLISSEYVVSSILYKQGKLIFTYKNKLLKRKSFVAIVTHDEAEYKQRLNEKNAIEYLGSFYELAPFLPANYFKYKYLGYTVFAMQECQGVTVDTASSGLKKMSENICDILIDLSMLTYRHEVINDAISGWLKILKTRSPDEQDNIAIIERHVNSYDLNMSVFMHGDAKIENFVLNKDNNVVGIIDWEHADKQGFPLIDLYYLIIYNYQIKYHCDFSEAFYALSHQEIADYEIEMLNSYCSKLKITDVERKKLIVVFFIHHYSCRFLADYKDYDGYTNFKKSLAVALDVIEELT